MPRLACRTFWLRIWQERPAHLLQQLEEGETQSPPPPQPRRRRARSRFQVSRIITDGHYLNQQALRPLSSGRTTRLHRRPCLVTTANTTSLRKHSPRAYHSLQRARCAFKRPGTRENRLLARARGHLARCQYRVGQGWRGVVEGVLHAQAGGCGGLRSLCRAVR